MNDHPTTDLFLDLTPERVLDAVEIAGHKTRPVCYALNSFENRVYEVELDSGERIVAKFYRPGRWTEAQIREEHAFMADVEAAEIAICPIMPFPDGDTLRQIEGIYYCLYPRRGGRAPDELSEKLAQRVGHLLGRLHNVGTLRPAIERQPLTVEAYSREDLFWLEDEGTVPEGLRDRYFDVAHELCDIAESEMLGVPVHRVHGDFHLGNLLIRDELLHVLDFDDCAMGPAVQDIWLAVSARDDWSARLRALMLEAYEQHRQFDRTTLRLIEPLRAMRLIHYAAWLAKRWHDPVFPRTWPHFGNERYWSDETESLEEILTRIKADKNVALAEGLTAADDAEPELTNKDLFWDWEGD